MHEDKQAICDALCKALQLTRNAYDVESLTYHKTDAVEIVVVRYLSGYEQVINVAMDSGTAMIRDIMKYM